MAAGDGLISMAPTGTSVGSGTATINSDGGVDFSSATSVSLDGVFTSDYDNYLLVMSHLGSSTGYEVRARMRLAGSDATDSGYYSQLLEASSTSYPGYLYSAQNFAVLSGTVNTGYGGIFVNVFAPALALQTAMTSVSVYALSGARIFDTTVSHAVSTAYDGITVYAVAGNLTGNIHVFGYEE